VGVALWGAAKREAPVRTEPHPTGLRPSCAGAFTPQVSSSSRGRFLFARREVRARIGGGVGVSAFCGGLPVSRREAGE
jgi:hypothetical protein